LDKISRIKQEPDSTKLIDDDSGDTSIRSITENPERDAVSRNSPASINKTSPKKLPKRATISHPPTSTRAAISSFTANSSNSVLIPSDTKISSSLNIAHKESGEHFAPSSIILDCSSEGSAELITTQSDLTERTSPKKVSWETVCLENQ
jgi:hypothetical protein